ncbi:carboxypeptidase-like regulatory domain-containing protein [Pseudarcicella hirudinis]|uniref:carboxypeptidase-like regulatory domain-containing protein n=1 Tax=Pseudarcicella hirudinis TaxID=1079859 RepID=UPI0015A640BE|nr:carboxypeptidase-like regulatory domain-containing protein [Pseudarcicella hirudinis]
MKLFAQGEDKTVQFSGRVVTDRNSEFLPNAYVFNPHSGRGTLSDNFGFFKLLVYPGDSIVFSYVGFRKRYYIIPRETEQVHSATIFMQEDTKVLAEVKVYPYSTEEDFKKAFMDMKLADERQRKALAENLEQSKLNVLALQAGMGTSANFRNFSQQMVFANANRNGFQSPLLALTNPFAWMNFIKSIKNGDLKRDDWKKAYELPPLENISRDKFLREQKREINGQ